ncbi:unnamed protein product [Orchesella dallaii]|uniref:Uncharacterized protein n=1 Tax=Orchesella dallaii TaxID=48710 RepID=A0ABP1Q9E9_9HEXA
MVTQLLLCHLIIISHSLLLTTVDTVLAHLHHISNLFTQPHHQGYGSPPPPHGHGVSSPPGNPVIQHVHHHIHHQPASVTVQGPPNGHPIAAVSLDHHKSFPPAHHRRYGPGHGHGHGKGIYDPPPPTPHLKPDYPATPPRPGYGSPPPPHDHGYTGPGGFGSLSSAEEYALSTKNPISIVTPLGINVGSFLPPPSQKS